MVSSYTYNKSPSAYSFANTSVDNFAHSKPMDLDINDLLILFKRSTLVEDQEENKAPSTTCSSKEMVLYQGGLEAFHAKLQKTIMDKGSKEDPSKSEDMDYSIHIPRGRKRMCDDMEVSDKENRGPKTMRITTD